MAQRPMDAFLLSKFFLEVLIKPKQMIPRSPAAPGWVSRVPTPRPHSRFVKNLQVGKHMGLRSRQTDKLLRITEKGNQLLRGLQVGSAP